MSSKAAVIFGSGKASLVDKAVQQVRLIFPEHEILVVSEFAPASGRWIPYHPQRSYVSNREFASSVLGNVDVDYSAILLDPEMPYWPLRRMGLSFTRRILIFNENLDHFPLHPRGAAAISRHILWRVRSYLRWQFNPGGRWYTFAWRLKHPSAFRRPYFYRKAMLTGRLLARRKSKQLRAQPIENRDSPPGISVVIPSRNGRDLLARLLPGLYQELGERTHEIFVVDNGSSDGTAEFLTVAYPEVRVIASSEPLAFSVAVNRGLRQAGFRFTCLLNNDMVLRPGFFAPLETALAQVPELFCATAQIFMPEGVRREETGKAVMPIAGLQPGHFPIRCDEPLDGENHSYVLYGSGGCSLYSTAKLTALGGFDETFQPAYVEDLALGFAAWRLGWPTVFVGTSQVVHAHRSTTSRYFSEQELERIVNQNYLQFLARWVSDPALFRTLWDRAVVRLNGMAAAHVPYEPAIAALKFAANTRSRIPAPHPAAFPEELIFAAGSGDMAVFPCGPKTGKLVVLIASAYLPFPLAHGGAVRMYNLMLRAASEFDLVLVSFCESWEPPPAELRSLCREIVLVRRHGTHVRKDTDRPDAVEEFASPVFGAALDLTTRKWRPAIAQFEFTQMAQYLGGCPGACTLLVEHDITYDLYGQTLEASGDWEARQQFERWKAFERKAWQQARQVVVMSTKDFTEVRGVEGTHPVCLPNGVDTERFAPSSDEPEPRRLLFVGSFGHLPNLVALDYFLREVWPLLQAYDPTLHVIAGSRHEYHLGRYEHRSRIDLTQLGIELEGFIPDVRPAHRRATVILAPLVVSAGTNIKVLEAMAMAKPVVSTLAGVNGLDVEAGSDYLLARSGCEMAQAIRRLWSDPGLCKRLGTHARATVCSRYDWDRIAEQQSAMYHALAKRG